MKHRVLCHIVPAPACLVKIIVVIVTPYIVDAGGKAAVIKTILVLSRIYNISLLAVNDITAAHAGQAGRWLYFCQDWTTIPYSGLMVATILRIMVLICSAYNTIVQEYLQKCIN